MQAQTDDHPRQNSAYRFTRTPKRAFHTECFFCFLKRHILKYFYRYAIVWADRCNVNPPGKEQTMGKKTRLELQAMFERVGYFYQRLARACKDGKWFHVHPDGTPAYEQRYNYVGDFSDEGLAQVCEDGKWFHIRPNGAPAYEQRYKVVGSFSEGLAHVCDKNGRHFHIRPDGTPAYEQTYDNAGPFSKGLALVWRDSKQFHISPDGTRAE